MDYWNYLAHSQKGAERANHKYYTRVQIGVGKLGFPQYRYFYTPQEYAAYKTGQQGKAGKPKGQTVYTTGHVTDKGGWELRTSAKTVRDYKKPLRNAKKKLTALRKEAYDSHNKNRWKIHSIVDTSIGGDESLRVTEKNRNGKVREAGHYHGEEAKKRNKELRRLYATGSEGDGGRAYKERKKRERKEAALEAVYQTNRKMMRAKRRAQKAGMDIRRTMRNATRKK